MTHRCDHYDDAGRRCRATPVYFRSCAEDRCRDVFARCERHGGQERVEWDLSDHLIVCWGRLAPRVPGLETAADVAEAGVLGLQSEHQIVTLQPVEAGRWVAALGSGTHLRQLGGSYESEFHAEAAGIAAWRVALAARMEEIRLARGGTLDWGIAVVEPSRPRIQVLVGRDATGGPNHYREREPSPEALRLSESPPVPSDKFERRRAARAAKRRSSGAQQRHDARRGHRGEADDATE